MKKVVKENGKLPTAKDYQANTKRLTAREKRRIEVTRAAMQAMMNEKVYENARS